MTTVLRNVFLTMPYRPKHFPTSLEFVSYVQHDLGHVFTPCRFVNVSSTRRSIHVPASRARRAAMVRFFAVLRAEVVAVARAITVQGAVV